MIMLERLEDHNLTGIRPLMSPRALKVESPLSVKAAETVAGARNAIRDVIAGRDARRLVVIVGPCSIHDPAAAIAYARRLSRTAEPLQGELVVVMRSYFEKPRTALGWKGLIHDPHLDGSCDAPAGLRATRALLLAISELGMPCGSEILNPFTPQYLGDLLCWGAIGARTAESQPHRQLASGLSMPIGFKNGTDCRLEVALNGMVAAKHPDSFLGITADGRAAVVETSGNPDRHLILRGGGGRTNFGPEDVAHAATLAADEELRRPILVDCSHGNSDKDYTRQGAVAREVARQFREGQRALMGLLIESNLRPGNQRWEEGGGLRYGVSITDACIGWGETEALLHEIAEAVRRSP
jgi:3-deoxy-7-phosphoheptulonate synthase